MLAYRQLCRWLALAAASCSSMTGGHATVSLTVRTALSAMTVLILRQFAPPRLNN